MISEEIVEEAIRLCESAQIDQPIAADQLKEYFDYAGAGFLPESDRVLLEFLLQVINKATILDGQAIDWSEETIESISEDNWKMYEVELGQDLEAFINQSFDLGEEEELMALVEDSLTEDMPKENQAIIWLACLAVIDAIE